VNDNRSNEGLYINGVNGRSKDKKKWGSKRLVGRGKNGKCNVVIYCSKGKVYYVMSNRDREIDIKNCFSHYF
jgi:hypothetical protein